MALSVIFLIALALRLVVAFLYSRLGEDFWFTTDFQYDLIASNIAAGKGYYIDGDYLEGLGRAFTGREKIYSFRSPLYPYTLAAVYKTFGRDPLAVGIFQALISSLTVLLLFWIGRKFFDEKVGLGAAFVAAIYPYSIYHDVRVFDTFLFELLLGLLILGILRLTESPTPLNGMLTGLLMGLAIHCRSSFATFTAFLFLPFLISYRFRLRQIVRMALPLILAEVLVLSPWLLRNYLIHGKFTLSTYGGWNFLLGNNELTRREILDGGEIDQALSRSLRDSSITLANLTEPEMDRWFYRKGIEFIKSHPGDFLELLWLKTLNLWSIRLNPPTDPPWKGLIYSLSYGTVLFLSLPGIAISLKKWRNFFLLYLLFIYFTVSYVPFITLSRYRKPLDPYLAMFGIYGLIHLYQKISWRRSYAKVYPT